MISLLTCIASDPNISAELRRTMSDKLQHRAACGWKRSFMTAEEAKNYGAGWNRWPDPIPEERPPWPYWEGWLDREADQILRDEERRDAGCARRYGAGEHG